MAQHHRLIATRAHLLELDGDRQAAAADYLEAARRATSLPERRYLAIQAVRLSGPPGLSGLPGLRVIRVIRVRARWPAGSRPACGAGG